VVGTEGEVVRDAVAVPLTTDPATELPTVCEFWSVTKNVTLPSFTGTAEVIVALNVTVWSTPRVAATFDTVVDVAAVPTRMSTDVLGMPLAKIVA
jgi:hypothetical protein